jgi:5-methylcytosine-specific restriction enzyme subunit McrC
MRRLVLREHTRIVRWRHDGPAPAAGEPLYLERRLYDRLKRFDQSQRDEADRVFSWGDDSARTQQWVGVIQVPGLQIEILPKVDATGPDESAAGAHEARRNLLYMLAMAGDVPVRSRDVARLASRQAPLSETLAAIFADRLLNELLRGPERAYLHREENLRRFKGKLLMAQQTLKNAAHRERFFCRFDELCDDTLLNRIFRAACRVLLDTTRTPSTQDLLRHCLLLLDQVEDVVIYDELFDRVTLTRQSERFADVFHFCRLILQDRAPTIQAGAARSFSLLFDMNQVFERFVAAFLGSRVMPYLDGYRLFPQARHRQRHLMTCDGHGVLPLRPDLLIEAPDSQRLVIDTKWKRLSDSGSRGGVSIGDLYQLYAYTRRYGCMHSILLYPHVPGMTARDFAILDHTDARSGERVGVRFVNLHRDLHLESERRQLADELTRLILDSFAPCGAVPQPVAVRGVA